MSDLVQTNRSKEHKTRHLEEHSPEQPPRADPYAGILALHDAAGNRATSQLLQAGTGTEPWIQTKLTINKPGDKYEEEADRMAEKVTHRSTSFAQRPPTPNGEETLRLKPLSGPVWHVVQRQTDEQDEEIISQAKVTSSHSSGPTPDLETRIDAIRGQGQSLPGATRKLMESSFHSDFSQVRIHADREAHQFTEQLQATAFTSGSDIFFRHGHYQPDTSVGQRLLAHELTHVLQQRQGANGRPNLIQRQFGRLRRLGGRAREAARGLRERLFGGGTGRGAIRKIEFNGRRVKVTGTPSFTAPALSGLMAKHPDAHGIDYTQPRYQHVPNKGPIPAGNYYINPADVESNPPVSFNVRAWGRYRTRLREAAVTAFRRRLRTDRTGGFYLHQDANHNGTAGCIGLVNARDNARIHRLIRRNTARIPVEVRYARSTRGLSRVRSRRRSGRRRGRRSRRSRRVQRSPLHKTTVQREDREGTTATPFLVAVGIRRLERDTRRYRTGHFPATYYDTLARHLFEAALRRNGRDYPAAFDSLNDLQWGRLGPGLRRAYERIVGTDSVNGWDKFRHYVYTAYLQYRSGGFLAPEVFTYGKEVWDEIERVFGSDPEGYSVEDIRADNLGEAFAEEMRRRELRERRPAIPMRVPPPVLPATGFGAGGGFRGLMERDRRRLMETLRPRRRSGP